MTGWETLMGLWQRMTRRHAAADVPPRTEMKRDPDLDMMHQEQHELINSSGYAASRIRDSWNQRLRDSWRPIHRDS